MKKIRKICLAIMLFFGIVSAASCSLFEDAVSLSIVDLPNSTFMVGQNMANVNMMKVTLTTKEGVTYTLNLSYDLDSQKLTGTSNNVVFEVAIANFSVETAGNRTASITYEGATSYFDYQVIESTSGFAGGNGEVNTPYQITSAEQFQNIAKVAATSNVYFKLMNDIDLSTINPVSASTTGATYVNTTFSGVLDGNNKKIFNVHTNTGWGCVFAKVSNATIKNVSLYMNDKETCVAMYVGGNTEFNNVSLYGTMSSGDNYGGFATYASSNSNIVFNSCTNYLDNISTAHYISAFVGYPSANCNFEFNNCKNYGHLEAQKVALFFANDNIATGNTYKVTNTTNYGVLFGTARVDFVCASIESTKISAKVDSQVVTNLGSTTLCPSVEFATLATVGENGQVSLNAVTTGSKIKSLKLVLTLAYMRTVEGGTSSASVEITVPASASASATGLYACKFVVKGSEQDTTETTDTIVTLQQGGKTIQWLKYNSTKNMYVFDGTTGEDVFFGGACTTFGTPSFMVYAYDENNTLVEVSKSVLVSSLLK